MLSALLDDPASAFDQGRHLADLHRRLDRVPVPADAGLPTPAGSPGRLLHGDLHPDNVLLAARGPVLIDWANAGSGPGAYDTATTWLVLACLDPAHPDVGTRLARVRRPLLRGFLSGIDRVAAESVMPRVAAARIADPATSAVEHGRIRSFTRRIGGSHDEES